MNKEYYWSIIRLSSGRSFISVLVQKAAFYFWFSTSTTSFRQETERSHVLYLCMREKRFTLSFTLQLQESRRISQ